MTALTKEKIEEWRLHFADIYESPEVEALCDMALRGLESASATGTTADGANADDLQYLSEVADGKHHAPPAASVAVPREPTEHMKFQGMIAAGLDKGTLAYAGLTAADACYRAMLTAAPAPAAASATEDMAVIPKSLLRDIQSNAACGEPEWSGIEDRLLRFAGLPFIEPDALSEAIYAKAAAVPHLLDEINCLTDALEAAERASPQVPEVREARGNDQIASSPASDAPLPEERDSWYPIETAPKDGIEFVAAYERQGFVKKLVNWSRIHRVWMSKGTFEPGFEENATHWTRLPAPPINSGAV